MHLVYVMLVLGGLLSFAGGVLNWEWFMTHRRSAFYVRLLGRTGARIFYIDLGIIATGIGAIGFNYRVAQLDLGNPDLQMEARKSSGVHAGRHATVPARSLKLAWTHQWCCVKLRADVG